MRRRLYLLLVPLLSCAAILGAAADVLAQRCGVERWAIKTGADADAVSVDVDHPQDASVAELSLLDPPRPIPPYRFAPVESTAFAVSARLIAYKYEGGSTGDSDYHLVLADNDGNTMVGEIPDPNCVDAQSPFASLIANARAEFDAQLIATIRFQETDVPVQVIGVGFFDFFHNQRGAAPNVIELHPILDIVFVQAADAPRQKLNGSKAR